MFMDEVRARRDGQSQGSSEGEGSKSSIELDSGRGDNQPEKVESSIDPVVALEEACGKISLGTELALSDTTF